MKLNLRRIVIFLLLIALSVGVGIGVDAIATAVEKHNYPMEESLKEDIRTNAQEFGIPEHILWGFVKTQSDFSSNAFDPSEKSKILEKISIPTKDQKEQYNIDADAEFTAVAKENGEEYTVFYPDTKSYWTWWLQQGYSDSKSAPLGNGYSTDGVNRNYGVRPMIWVSIG